MSFGQKFPNGTVRDARKGRLAVRVGRRQRVQAGAAALPADRATGAHALLIAALVLTALVFAVLAAAPLSAAQDPATAPIKVVVFPFELVDTSQEGERDGARADQEARLDRLATDLKAQLAASGRYEIVELTPPVEAEYARLAPMRGCNGCDIDLAKAVGATQGMVGIVQKVSNLILDVAIYVRDVETGRVLQVAKTSIRGNTDESWQRGLRFLVDNRLLAAPPGGAPN